MNMIAARHAKLEAQLREIVKATSWLVEVLRVVQRVGPHGAYVAAGAVRDTVWNLQRGYPSMHASVDVVYWDPSEVAEQATVHQAKFARVLPRLRWRVTNQAFLVLRHRACEAGEVPPLESVLEGLATWLETATAAGVRLSASDDIEVIAPFISEPTR